MIRRRLPQDTLPLAAHDEVVSTIADDFSRRQAALRAQVEQRDTSLRRAANEVRSVSDNLTVLKRDVGSLRNALGRCDLVLLCHCCHIFCFLM